MWPILLALVPAFGWGFQGIVMQKVGGTTANKQMGMVLTTLLFGIVVLIFHPINWSWTLIAAAAINGIPWSIAQILQIKSFDYLGVARAMPLSTGMQLVFTTLLGALFFHEWTHGWQFGFGICALVVIIVGVACTAFQEKSEDKGPSNLKLGLLITLISSLLYTSYAAAGKFFSVSSWDMLFPQAAFMVLVTTIISFFMSGKDAMDPEIGVFGKKSCKLLLRPLIRTKTLPLMFQNPSGHCHRFQESSIASAVIIPYRIEHADHTGEFILFSCIIIEIERLYKLLVKPRGHLRTYNFCAKCLP